MGEQAARDGDPTECGHGQGNIETINTRRVEINGYGAAKLNDAGGCPGKRVVTGSRTVLVNNLPAARAKDFTSDGRIALGSANVFIGGPRVGGAVGTYRSQGQACKEAAGTRTSGSRSQSYGNCGLESIRNTINEARRQRGLPPVTEDDLFKEATDMGLAVNNPGKHNHGAIGAPGQAKLLTSHGVDAKAAEQTSQSIQEAVESGKSVAITIHPYHWPGDEVDDDHWHSVAVTGVEYDDGGRVAGFIISDTGLGQCSIRLSLAQMTKNQPKRPVLMVVTSDPVW